MRAVLMRRFGGPEVLEIAEVPEPGPRRGHLLVEVTRAGVNYADMHVRGDTYLAPVALPYIPGNEIVGVAEDGRRIAALTHGGGYAEKALAHHRVSWHIPDDVTDDQAAALTLQGNSAWHLLFTAAQLTARQRVVIPAAAGGLGSLAVQLAKRAGATVVALAGSDEKRRIALSLGADSVVDSSTAEGLTERILEAAGGPVQVALEMTGGATFHATLAAVAPRGRLVVYGYASGEHATAPTAVLMEKSITVTGFWLPHLYADRDALPTSMKALFSAVGSGELRPMVSAVLPLAEAARAHASLAARTSTGKILLSPMP